MSEVQEKGTRARKAARVLMTVESGAKNKTLQLMADSLLDSSTKIIDANQQDLELAQEANISRSLQDRLRLNHERIKAIAEGVRIICQLPDPIGETISSWTRPSGISINKVRVPLGVVGIIYEARPNVTVDAAAICFKAGNAVLLRGSSSAVFSNRALVEVIRQALAATDLPADAVQLIEDTRRESVLELVRANGLIDVVIPRGGAELIKHVVGTASVPVLETGAGNCHIYIDQQADCDQAISIVLNAKTQRPSVCNAVETVLIHKDWAGNHLANLIDALRRQKVECRGCQASQRLASGIEPATEADWETEYLDLTVAIKIVDDLNQAIAHINSYGTRHSEAIISTNLDNVKAFFRQVDAAVLYHNASTRFTDGFEFGFGAEIGISTQKLHARGPMGLSELTTYKYLVEGSGQIREP